MRAGTLFPLLVVVLAGQARALLDSQFTLPLAMASPACMERGCDSLQQNFAACGARAGCLCSAPLTDNLKQCLDCLVDAQPADAVRPVQDLVNQFRVVCADAKFNVQRIVL